MEHYDESSEDQLGSPEEDGRGSVRVPHSSDRLAFDSLEREILGLPSEPLDSLEVSHYIR